VSLYGDAIKALRQVILLDERVRNTSANLVRMSRELTDLRDKGEPSGRDARRELGSPATVDPSAAPLAATAG
jgi:hypothetical protein